MAILEIYHSEPICSVPGTSWELRHWARQSLISGCATDDNTERANIVREGQRK